MMTGSRPRPERQKLPEASTPQADSVSGKPIQATCDPLHGQHGPDQPHEGGIPPAIEIFVGRSRQDCRLGLRADLIRELFNDSLIRCFSVDGEIFAASH